MLDTLWISIGKQAVLAEQRNPNGEDMFIPVAKVQELIDIAKECDRKLPEEEKRIHVLDIAATLQKLIDDELDELDKMADEFKASHQDEESEQDEASAEWTEIEEAAKAVMDWHSQTKMMDEETRKMCDWPGGL